MKIDVTKLLTNLASSINIDSMVTIPDSFLTDSRIDALENVYVTGKIIINEEYDLVLKANIKGTMVLKDDITLEPVRYEFSTDTDDILPNNQNVLDITDILWQNILVEIPSKVRSTIEDVYLSGDGWRVISEDKYNEERNKHNNPFSSLDELLETKEDK